MLLGFQIHAGHEIGEPADARFGEHEPHAGVPLERPREDHRCERLVELHGGDAGEGGHLPAAGSDAQHAGARPEVKADRHGVGRRGVPQRLPDRVDDAGRELEDGEDDAPVPELRDPPELGDRRLHGVRRQHGQDGEAPPVVRVEVVRPVVVRDEARGLQLLIGDREPEERRAVDDRRVDAVPLHVLQAERRVARAKAVVRDAGAGDRAVVAHHLGPARAERGTVRHPPVARLLLDDPWPALS